MPCMKDCTYLFLCIYAYISNIWKMYLFVLFVYLVTSVSEILAVGLSCFVVTLKPTNLLHLLLHSLGRVIINNKCVPFYIVNIPFQCANRQNS